MEGILRDIIFGAIGSVLGGLFVFVSMARVETRIPILATAAKTRRREEDLWLSMKLGVRQAITNEYIFAILWCLFIANMLWVLTEMFSPFISRIDSHGTLYVVVNSIGLILSLIFFFRGLSRIGCYLQLRSLDDPSEIERIARSDSQQKGGG